MPYSYQEIPESEFKSHYFDHGEGDGLPVTVDELIPLKQYEILDPQEERITIVFDETGAKELIRHLNRIEAVEEKPKQTFSLWVEGYSATGEAANAQCLGAITGTDFNDAVKNYVEKLSESSRSYWSFRNDRWSYWGCRAYDNEADARRSFG